MALFGDHRRRTCGPRQVLREVNVDNEENEWESDGEDQEDEEGSDVENCGVLSNTIFNLDD